MGTNAQVDARTWPVRWLVASGIDGYVYARGWSWTTARARRAAERTRQAVEARG